MCSVCITPSKPMDCANLQQMCVCVLCNMLAWCCCWVVVVVPFFVLLVCDAVAPSTTDVRCASDEQCVSIACQNVYCSSVAVLLLLRCRGFLLCFPLCVCAVVSVATCALACKYVYCSSVAVLLLLRCRGFFVVFSTVCLCCCFCGYMCVGVCIVPLWQCCCYCGAAVFCCGVFHCVFVLLLLWLHVRWRVYCSSVAVLLLLRCRGFFVVVFSTVCLCCCCCGSYVTTCIHPCWSAGRRGGGRGWGCNSRG